MRIEKVIISNFRSYKDQIEIDINDMNVFVGKNDIGKSTVLEALDMFFNEGKGVVKFDREDLNKQALAEDDLDIKIGVVFSELPSTLTIDTSNQTTLQDEYLLNSEGYLEVHKKYPNGGKEKVFVIANHPTNPACADLLLKKQTDLKRLLTDDMSCEDKTKNSEIRKAIWSHHESNLSLQNIEIETTKEEAKNIWEQLKKELPMYALFQSDRKNSDGDSEIQDPMKIAVQDILKDPALTSQLNNVAVEVKRKLDAVANNTLEKLKEMNPEIADTLVPITPKPESLKWADVFKSVSISSDDDIPINKRGSGVKRLVLLNFFRAEAERRKLEESTTDIIYAIEEPETSQHLNHQRKLIEAFVELAESDNTQILLTTHSSAIVKMLQFEHLKLIRNNPDKSIENIEPSELPYPSLSEVNYLAFGESDSDYHNELYGFIESEGWLGEYKQGKPTVQYIRLFQDGTTKNEQKIKSEYIRHLIHHPENTHNTPYEHDDLQYSINDMREFIQQKNTPE